MGKLAITRQTLLATRSGTGHTHAQAETSFFFPTHPNNPKPSPAYTALKSQTFYPRIQAMILLARHRHTYEVEQERALLADCILLGF